MDAWIRTIPWDEATGELADAYNWQAASLGEPAEFTMLGSLYPAIVDERLRLYRTVENCPSSLDPVERQAAAWVVSLLNGTDHCASGLSLKLTSLGLADDAKAAIASNPAAPNTGQPRLDAILAHAAKLTSEPTNMDRSDLDTLRGHGLDDLDLVDLNNMISYYNYINRVVMGLGLRSTMSTTREATSAVPPPHVS
jgi:uncharacterized peroxidase-related enzyme